METYFAPAQRTERRKFENQINDVSQSPIMTTLLKTMTGLLVVLNEDRQIVALNHAFLDAIGVKDPVKALGLRLGESLKCIHAADDPAGCGTTQACLSCGAAIAMMAAISDDKIDERICALAFDDNGTSGNRCLAVKAQPIYLENKKWILFFVRDITNQQFWVNLEKVFFHDINNMVSALLGNCKLLAMELPDNTAVSRINDAAERIGGEVSLQRTLSKYKDASYLIRETKTSLMDIKKEVDLIIKGHDALGNKQMNEQWPNDSTVFKTDRLLVSKVIGNMVINALEATPADGMVKLAASVENDTAVWSVWNDAYIPKDIQKRIFQRHFSTKPGDGRGMGTYSMKLFGETYLKGKVDFITSKVEGTTFTFRLPLLSA